MHEMSPGIAHQHDWYMSLVTATSVENTSGNRRNRCDQEKKSRSDKAGTPHKMGKKLLRIQDEVVGGVCLDNINAILMFQLRNKKRNGFHGSLI
jgi:hypothetical protein